jgi:putative membrane protein
VTRDETGDATRRTLLAAERTLLAWLRTGLTVLAVAVGIGKIAPDLADAANATAWALLGALYAVLGVAIVVYGFWRGRAVDEAVRAGRYVSLRDNVMWTIGGVSVVLGLATAVLIVIDL